MIQALLAPLPYQLNDAGAIQTSPPKARQTTSPGKSGEDTTPTLDGASGPSRPLDMVLIILRNVHGTFPPELGANACALLMSAQSQQVKEAAKGVLEGVAAGLVGGKGTEETPKVLREGAKRCLSVWAATASGEDKEGMK